MSTRIVVRGSKASEWREITLTQLSRYCIHVHGCYREDQIVAGMEMQHEILDGEVYTSATGMEIKLEEYDG